VADRVLAGSNDFFGAVSITLLEVPVRVRETYCCSNPRSNDVVGGVPIVLPEDVPVGVLERHCGSNPHSKDLFGGQVDILTDPVPD
jgi:hypothetical protein